MEESSLKKPAMVAMAAMGLLVILSAVFYKERILFADSAFKLFDIIVNKKFSIDEHRYGSFITQLLPMLAQRLNLPVKSIVMLYSMSFNIFFLAVMGVLVYGLRQYRLAVIMSLYYFLFVSACFFWPNDEIHQAVAWMFLLFGIMIRMNAKQTRFIPILLVWIAGSAVVIFTHFIALIPTCFLLVFFTLEKKTWHLSWKHTIILGTTLIVITKIKLLLTFQQSYDAGSLKGVTHSSLTDIRWSFSKPIVTDFLHRCISNYWIGLALFCIGIACMIRAKAVLQLGLVTAVLLGYCVLIGLALGTIPKDYHLFYTETEWACVGIIVAVIFAYYTLPYLKPGMIVILLSAVFLIRSGYILAAAPQFTWRIQYKEQVFAGMKKRGMSKAAFFEERQLMDKLMFYWAIPEETLLQSAIDGDKPGLTFTLVRPDDTQRIDLLMKPGVYVSAYGIIERPDLNRRYFSIDTSNYNIMKYQDILK